MSVDLILRLSQEALWLTVALGAPPILAAMVVGLIVSVLQAATQIHEATIAFALKLCAMSLALFLLGSWILEELVRFTTYVFDGFPRWIN